MKREIVVYRNRGQGVAYVILYTCLSSVLIGVLSLLVWLIQASNAACQVLCKNTASSLDSFNVFIITIGVLGILVSARMIWHLVTRQILVRDPVMVINHEGIQIGKLPLAIGEAFISWDEIGKIYCYRFFSRTYFCIRPKNPKQYLSRFGLWKRWMMYINLPSAAPIYVEQHWIMQPISEILQQMCLQYAQELQSIQLQF